MNLRHALFLLTVLSVRAEGETQGNKTEDSSEYYYEYYEDVDYTGGIDIPEKFQTYLETALTRTQAKPLSRHGIHSKDGGGGSHSEAEARHKHRSKHHRQDFTNPKHLKHNTSRNHKIPRANLIHPFMKYNKNSSDYNFEKQRHKFGNDSYNDPKIESIIESQLKKESKPSGKNISDLSNRNTKGRDKEMLKPQQPDVEDLLFKTNALSKFLSYTGSKINRAKENLIKHPFMNYNYAGLLGNIASKLEKTSSTNEKQLPQPEQFGTFKEETTKPKTILKGRSKSERKQKPVINNVNRQIHNQPVRDLIDEQPILSKYFDKKGEFTAPNILNEKLLTLKHMPRKLTNVSRPDNVYKWKTPFILNENEQISSNADDNKKVNTKVNNTVVNEESDLQDGRNSSSVQVNPLTNSVGVTPELVRSVDKNITEDYRTAEEKTSESNELFNSTGNGTSTENSNVTSIEKSNDIIKDSNTTYTTINNIVNGSFSHPLEELIASLAHEVSTKFVKKRKVKRPAKKAVLESDKIETPAKDKSAPADNTIANETNIDTLMKESGNLSERNKGLINNAAGNVTYKTEVDSSGKTVRTVRMKRRKIRKPKKLNNLKQINERNNTLVQKEENDFTNEPNEAEKNFTSNNDTSGVDYNEDTLENRISLESNKSNDNVSIPSLTDETAPEVETKSDVLLDNIEPSERSSDKEDERDISQSGEINNVNNVTSLNQNTTDQSALNSETGQEMVNHEPNTTSINQSKEQQIPGINQEDIRVNKQINDTSVDHNLDEQTPDGNTTSSDTMEVDEERKENNSDEPFYQNELEGNKTLNEIVARDQENVTSPDQDSLEQNTLSTTPTKVTNNYNNMSQSYDQHIPEDTVNSNITQDEIKSKNNDTSESTSKDEIIPAQDTKLNETYKVVNNSSNITNNLDSNTKDESFPYNSSIGNGEDAINENEVSLNNSTEEKPNNEDTKIFDSSDALDDKNVDAENISENPHSLSKNQTIEEQIKEDLNDNRIVINREPTMNSTRQNEHIVTKQTEIFNQPEDITKEMSVIMNPNISETPLSLSTNKSEIIEDNKVTGDPEGVVEVIVDGNPPCSATNVANSYGDEAITETDVSDYENEPNTVDVEYESKPCTEKVVSNKCNVDTDQNKQVRKCVIQLQNGEVKKIVCPPNKSKIKHHSVDVASPYETVQVFETVVKKKTVTRRKHISEEEK